MLEVHYTWSSTGTSGGLTAISVDGLPENSALFCQSSTIASTQSFSFQTAQDSTGPWVTELSTAVTATATAISQDVLRLVGPYMWMRPRVNSGSTGTYQFKLIGQG